MRLARTLFMIGFGLSAMACGDDDGGAPGADAGVDAQTNNPETDAGAGDAGTTDAQVATDAGNTTDAGSFMPPEGCNYEGWMPYALDCGGAVLTMSSLLDPEDLEGARCPEIYELEGVLFETQAAALASRSCSPSCVRIATTAVSLLRCGMRDGYDLFEDPEEDCPDVISTRDGYFGSVREWEAASPCE